MVPEDWRCFGWRVAVIGLAGLSVSGQALVCGVAQGGQLDRARARLDAANRAAQDEQAAARAALRATKAAAAREAVLVQQEVAATARLRATETATADLVSQLDQLSGQTSAAHAELKADEAAIAPLLPLVARLALHPAATLLAADAVPGRAAEGAMIMRGLTREIGRRASALRLAARRYTASAARLAAEQATLDLALKRQQSDASAVQADIVSVRQQEAASMSRREAALRAASRYAGQAHDLVGVIARLSAVRQRAAARVRSAAARVKLPKGLGKALGDAPVAGHLVRAFGAATAAGPATGETFATAPGAVVSAACAGQVVFARPFETYGKLLILDCGGGYDFVMAGLDRFDARVGQTVRTGQPVGAMAGYDPHEPGNLPRLYVELRSHGTAVNPALRLGRGP